MSTSILEETLGRVPVARLSVDQYESMIERGILPEGEPIELIDGLLVFKDRAALGGRPMTVGTLHQLVMEKLNALGPSFRDHGCFLRLQAPIRIPPHNEPEPDVAVVRGKPGDYAEAHPSPRDVLSAIEVSESSLERDRTTKHRLYAAAGIRQYIVINLVDRQVEVYFSPHQREARYRDKHVLKGAKNVGIAAGDSKKYVRVAAEDLLP